MTSSSYSRVSTAFITDRPILWRNETKVRSIEPIWKFLWGSAHLWRCFQPGFILFHRIGKNLVPISKKKPISVRANYTLRARAQDKPVLIKQPI